MRIVFHGTGAGEPSADRGASALSVASANGDILLLDAGEACSRAMIRDGIDLRRITTVAISHTHADHWCGLPALLVAWAMARRTEPVDLYLPPGSLDFFDTIFTTSYTLPDRLPFSLNFHELAPFVLGDDWEVTPFPTTHLDRYKGIAGEHGIPYPAFGYQLTHGERRVIFSQDIGSVNDLAGIMAGAELVVCEATHIEPRELLLLAREKNVKHVVFTHIPPDESNMPNIDEMFDGVTWQIVRDGDILTV